jgi:hypothetical protein
MKFKSPGIWTVEPMTESYMESNWYNYKEDQVIDTPYYESWKRGKIKNREEEIKKIL